MTDWLTLVGAAIAGVALGMVYFGGLWLTVRYLPTTTHPILLTFGSYLLRMAIVLLGFYIIMDNQWERLVAAVITFILTRMFLMRFLPLTLETTASDKNSRA